MSKRKSDSTNDSEPKYLKIEAQEEEITFKGLMSECFSGKLDLDTVKRAIQQKLDLNTIDEDGWTLLHAACRENRIDIVKELIAQQVDIDRPENDGCTPFHIACANNGIDIVRELIAQGVDTEKREKYSCTPFYVACINGHIDIVRELIAQHVDIEKPDNDGWSPFYAACRRNHIDIVRELSKIVSISELEKNLFRSNDDAITDILLYSLGQRRYSVIFPLLLFGQKQSESPLSVLHRDLLQDTQKVIKEKIFL